MARFFCLHELRKPEDMRPFLADPELHWRKGYSACELATSCVTADDIPSPVRTVLDTCSAYHGAELVARGDVVSKATQTFSQALDSVRSIAQVLHEKDAS